MKKALAFSSMVGAAVLPALSMVAPKVGLLALLAFAGATLLTTTSNFLGVFVTLFFGFFSAGGTTATELILAF